MTRGTLFLLLLFSCATPNLRADVAVLLEQPYGGFGHMNPTGHAAVYLDRVCASSPTKLRRCHPGEAGVVISRYYKISGYDWIAIPLIPYLYAVENAQDVPLSADSKTVALLRNSYRERYLRDLVPDTPTGEPPQGEWYQLIGAAFDRKTYAFEIETSEAQDDAFIHEFNSRTNVSHFNLLFGNCADFTRDVINFYYPHALRRSIVADLGITTPKQIAKAMVRYSKRHPKISFHVFVIDQIPGNRPPSKHTRGVLESLVKSKKYVVPLFAINVWLAPVFAIGYIATGRFSPDRYVEVAYDPVQLEGRALLAQERSQPVQENAAGMMRPHSKDGFLQSNAPIQHNLNAPGRGTENQ